MATSEDKASPPQQQNWSCSLIHLNLFLPGAFRAHRSLIISLNLHISDLWSKSMHPPFYVQMLPKGKFFQISSVAGFIKFWWIQVKKKTLASVTAWILDPVVWFIWIIWVYFCPFSTDPVGERRARHFFSHYCTLLKHLGSQLPLLSQSPPVKTWFNAMQKKS